MHGGGGAGNSKARRQILERQIFRSWKERAAQEVGVKRACCEGGRRQIMPEDSKNVQIEEQIGLLEEDQTGYRLFLLCQQPAKLVAISIRKHSLRECQSRTRNQRAIEGVYTRARICKECWKDGTQLFVYLRFLYIFTPSMFATHQFRVKESAIRMILLHLVEETGLWSC